MQGSNLPKSVFFGLAIAAILGVTPPLSGAQTLAARPSPGSLLALREGLGFQNIELDSSGQVAVQFADTATVHRHQKSPLLAILFSTIPGGGQIYNGSYWKVPIIWGVQAYFVSQWIANNKNFNLYQSEYSKSITTSNPNGDGTLMSHRDTYLDQRDSYSWYIAGTYLLSILDAYVDAELSGFDVSPQLGSIPSGRSVNISFSMKF